MAAPRPTSHPRLALGALAVFVIAAAGLARRERAVTDYRNYAGDGWQYYHLAKSLVVDGRYAFGPPPLPLAWSRLPGYPLYVAATGKPAPRFNDADVQVRVARSQAILDTLTCLAAFLLAAEIGLVAPRFLALALCAASPFLAMSVCYVLSETLATFLTTVTLWLLVRGARRRLSPHLAVAGMVTGAALLVRADAVTLLPCFLVPLSLARASLVGKARAAGLATLGCLLVVSPWPLRNLARFGRTHALGASWVTMQGDPLPTGIQAWLATWAVDPRAAAEVAWKVTKGQPVLVDLLPAEAFDTPAERARIAKLLDEYERTGIVSRAVDEGFRAIGRERRARDPVRFFLKLPVCRMYELWITPVPEWEMPLTSATLGLPGARSDLAPLNRRTLLVAAAGLLVLLVVRRGRALGTIVVVAALARTVAMVFIVPGGTQRYTFELLPAVLVLAAVALAGPAELLHRRLVRR